MEKHPKAPANNKRLYGQNAAVALKYNPDMNYAPVVVALMRSACSGSREINAP